MESGELEQCRKAFQEAQSEAKKLTEGLTEAQFNWRPAEGQWSIEECLEHLTVVGMWEAKAVERAIDDAQARGPKGNGPFQYGWFERWIVRSTEPPVRRKFRSPRQFVPIHEQPVTAVVPTFLHVQSMFLQQIERAQGLDLARVKVATPISSLFRMSLGMTLVQAAAHQRRHLEQARLVRDQIR